MVDGQDFTILKYYFGGPGGWDQGDFTGDGLIDGQDFTVLKAYFGDHPVPLAAAASMVMVPEPATMVLLGIGAASLLARRRRT